MDKKLKLAIVASVTSGVALLGLLFFSPKKSSPVVNEQPQSFSSSLTGGIAVFDSYVDLYSSSKQVRIADEKNQIKFALQEAKSLISRFRFLDAAEKLEPFFLKGALSDDEVKVYRDASLLATIFATEGEKPDKEQIPILFEHLQDVETVLIGTLALPDDLRGKVIVNKDSLNPIFDGIVTILNTEEETGEVKRTISYRQGHVDQVFRVNFIIEGFPLIAHVMKQGERVRVYEIIEKEEGTTPYRKISEWEKMYKDYNLTPSSDLMFEERE